MEHWILVLEPYESIGGMRLFSLVNSGDYRARADFVDPVDLLEQKANIPVLKVANEVELQTSPDEIPGEGAPTIAIYPAGYSVLAKLQFTSKLNGKSFRRLSGFTYLGNPDLAKYLRISLYTRVVKENAGVYSQKVFSIPFLPCFSMQLPSNEKDFVCILECNFTHGAVKDFDYFLNLFEQEIGAQPCINSKSNFSPYEVLGIGFHEQFGFTAPVTTLKSADNLILRERIYVKPEEGADRVNATIRITCSNNSNSAGGKGGGVFFTGRLILQKPPPTTEEEVIGPGSYGNRHTWLESLEVVCTEEGKDSLLFAHLELFPNAVYILEVESESMQSLQDSSESWRMDFFGDGKMEVGNETMETDLETLVLNGWAKEAEVSAEDRLESGEISRTKWLEEGAEGELKSTLAVGPSKITDEEGAIPENPDKHIDDIIKDRYQNNLNKKGHVNMDVLSFLEDVLERPVYFDYSSSFKSENLQETAPVDFDFDWDKFHTISKAALDKNSKTLEIARKWYNNMSCGQGFFDKERGDLIANMQGELEAKQAEIEAAAAGEQEAAGGQ